MRSGPNKSELNIARKLLTHVGIFCSFCDSKQSYMLRLCGSILSMPSSCNACVCPRMILVLFALKNINGNSTCLIACRLVYSKLWQNNAESCTMHSLWSNLERRSKNMHSQVWKFTEDVAWQEFGTERYSPEKTAYRFPFHFTFSVFCLMERKDTARKNCIPVHFL